MLLQENMRQLLQLKIIFWLVSVGLVGTAQPLVNFSDIPVLPDGPGKGCYACFQGKNFDVLVTTNLDFIVYPMEAAKRTDKPVIIENYFSRPFPYPNPPPSPRFVSIVQPAPPAMNPPKLFFELVTDNGIHVSQTWKFMDGALSVENEMKGYAGIPPVLRIGIQFPRTHTFASNITPAERAKATSGYSLRCRTGGTENTMKLITIPYANRVELQSYSDRMEHQGPWGTRKVSIKRTGLRGMFIMGNAVYAHEGAWLLFLTRSDAKNRVNPQGFEFKVE